MFFLLTSLVSFSFLINLTKKSSIDIFKEQAFLFFLVFLIYFQCMYFLLLLLFSVSEEREVSENGAKLQLVGPRFNR